MARSLKDDVFNIPNVLTFGRIVLIPFVLWMLQFDTRLTSFAAALLFSLAAVTDWLDGWLARNKGWTSVLGKFLDPLADKLLVMACLIMLVELGRCPAWLAVLLVAREIAVTGLRSIASNEGLSVEVSQAGKWKTAFQLSGLVALLLYYPYTLDYLVAAGRIHMGALGQMLLLLSVVLSLGSAILYFRDFVRALGRKYRDAGKLDG